MRLMRAGILLKRIDILLGRDYQQWLCNRAVPLNYSELATKLANTDYIWIFDLDQNRAEGGLVLRSEYAIETGVYQSDVADGPCSCLEMMIAYSRNLVQQSGYGNEQTFFNDFLFNTGLAAFDDAHWDDREASAVIDIWLNREYQPNGQGNLLVTGLGIDLRTMDTWSQLATYVNEYY